jgi:hypothetical protein
MQPADCAVLVLVLVLVLVTALHMFASTGSRSPACARSRAPRARSRARWCCTHAADHSRIAVHSACGEWTADSLSSSACAYARGMALVIGAIVFVLPCARALSVLSCSCVPSWLCSLFSGLLGTLPARSRARARTQLLNFGSLVLGWPFSLLWPATQFRYLCSQLLDGPQHSRFSCSLARAQPRGCSHTYFDSLADLGTLTAGEHAAGEDKRHGGRGVSLGRVSPCQDPTASSMGQRAPRPRPLLGQCATIRA